MQILVGSDCNPVRLLVCLSNVYKLYLKCLSYLQLYMVSEHRNAIKFILEAPFFSFVHKS